MDPSTLRAALLLALITAGCATAETRITAVRAERPPVLDGNAAEGLWANAAELGLVAKARGGPAKGETTTVVLKAAYDDEQLYFLLRWQDERKDDMHKSYVWNDEKGAYVAGPDREDNAALSFPIRGAFTANMLSGKDELWDVWHWKAHRTGPAGYTMDRTHRFSSTKPPGKAKQFTARNGQEVWIARPEDDGSSVTKGHPAPSSKQADVPVHYEAVTPTGSAADIRTGLLGWVSCVVNDTLILDGLTLRRTQAGKLTLSYPDRRDGSGRQHHYLRPVDDRARRDIESQILAKLGAGQEAAS